MNFEEFESQTRDVIEQTLNQLHTASLQIAQLEAQIAETGRTVQALSRLVEQFIAEQQAESHDSSPKIDP